MNYNLTKEQSKTKAVTWSSIQKVRPILSGEKAAMIWTIVAALTNAVLMLGVQRLMAWVIDHKLITGDLSGVIFWSLVILVMYLVVLVTNYLQTWLMGGVGQRVLYKLRARIFDKLQSLPMAFFNQNKAGDLMARINNDTEKINQFFSQGIVQFVSNIFMMGGSAIFLLVLNWRLGLATLAPAMALLALTMAVGPWIRDKNAQSAAKVSAWSAAIDQSLSNFKAIIAFNRRDYFEERLGEVNQENYQAAVKASVANNIFTPIYAFAASLGQLAVLAYGLALIASDKLTIGLLIAFLAYAANFYNPLRHLAALWTSLQTALASWERVHEILILKNNLPLLTKAVAKDGQGVLEFRAVDFAYPDGRQVLSDINLVVEAGKSYALVGPTGGGKTTTAMLAARLYDPSAGKIFLDGRDIRSYSDEERSAKIGFILQEPILFSGTVGDNIICGQGQYDQERAEEMVKRFGLDKLLVRFDKGLATEIKASGEGMSFGQKQLIAFMRAIVREPELLILDEATANIDTVTEALLTEVLDNLPKASAKIIIAHRLNTIENADEIFFVNDGQVKLAGSMKQALAMLNIK